MTRPASLLPAPVLPAPVLIAFSGLPGAGKSSIARALAVEIGATWLRIDTIEQALRASGVAVTIEGYVVAYRLAVDNLRLGRSVVADSVNPIDITRDAWRGVALEAGVKLVEVEIVCSDPVEHRRRVETRRVDVAGLALPTWQAVTTREFHPWIGPRVVIDTAARSIAESVSSLLEALQKE